MEKNTTLFFNPNTGYIGIGVDIAKHFVSVFAIDEDASTIYEPKMPHDTLVQELANRDLLADSQSNESDSTLLALQPPQLSSREAPSRC